MIALWMAYATVVGAAFGLAALVVDRSAEMNGWPRRWIWLAALLATVALPVWTATRPAPFEAGVVAEHPSRAEPARDRTTGLQLGAQLAELVERARPSAGRLTVLDSRLATAWALVSVALLGIYLAAAYALARRRRAWREADVDGEPVLVAADTGPAVVGALRPRIVLPAWSLELSPVERELMLAHEREHLRAHDPLLLHGAALLVVAMPWNVAAWWLVRRLRLAVELDCDARVLGAGRDAGTYGTLLLNVCGRRARGLPLVAPALLERTSSLARRILAMHPRRPRFPRAHAALTAAFAVMLVALACEAPSPEVFAPDGRNAEARRVYGKVTAERTARSPAELRALVERHFPDVARGEGGPSILFLVESEQGDIVLTEREPAGPLLAKVRRDSSYVEGVKLSADTIQIVDQARIRARSRLPYRTLERKMASAAKTPGSAAGRGVNVPNLVGALRQEDINSVEVTKYAAGNLAPEATSLILITLRAGARVPLRASDAPSR